MKNNYPFLVRLIILAPAIIIMSVVWALIGIFSSKRLAKILIVTGHNLLNDQNIKNKST